MDNGSTDGSIDMVRQMFPEVALVEAGENLGFGRAHNRAMAMGTGRHFIVLNPDTIVEPNTFRRLVRFMDETPDAGACGPTVKDATGAFAHSGHRDMSVLSVAANAFNLRAILPRDEFCGGASVAGLGTVHSAYHPHDTLRIVDWVDGACLVVRRAAWEQTGGFDERIFLNAEDFDWCYRMRQKGWRIYHVPDVSLVHLMHQSKEQVYVPSFVAHYRSVIYLFRKHHGVALSASCARSCSLAFSGDSALASITDFFGGRARHRAGYRGVSRRHPDRADLRRRRCRARRSAGQQLNDETAPDSGGCCFGLPRRLTSVVPSAGGPETPSSTGARTAMRLKGGVGRTRSSARIAGTIQFSTLIWSRPKARRFSSRPLTNQASVPTRLNSMRRSTLKPLFRARLVSDSRWYRRWCPSTSSSVPKFH